MPKPRYTQIAKGETPYVHIISRCVRRAYLCGMDAHTGRSYEHRRQWIEEEILRLSGIFSLEVAAYSVMSNHFHLVLYINHGQAAGWNDDEVIMRWQLPGVARQYSFAYAKHALGGVSAQSREGIGP